MTGQLPGRRSASRPTRRCEGDVAAEANDRTPSVINLPAMQVGTGDPTQAGGRGRGRGRAARGLLPRHTEASLGGCLLEGGTRGGDGFDSQKWKVFWV